MAEQLILNHSRAPQDTCDFVLPNDLAQTYLARVESLLHKQEFCSSAATTTNVSANCVRSDVLVFADEITDNQLKAVCKHSSGVNSSIQRTLFAL